ncbi:Clp protease N-terminal domain-containing protein [Streptomyces sp. ME02-8801-2C]|uniref:Clp protease N-terminal domain-containing protein n=1 Tax=Streptomyces sp. ME02-8801-2C TaxID=3028680 RepID=UPI0029B498AE|nr:Clp protease N-terminal domain-containing protein [Streptomyces sp. ME02-8801-2C]MDX3456711.1 Clp protease N-terminal domain-containing protein [Streptomyces sp. ME02-8801-2C]
MFERFTSDARAVVQGAVEHAERIGSRWVGAECLLLALLDREGGRASFALASLGLADRKEPVRAALADARRRAGLSQAEADALAGLGIDVSDIVSRVEEVHGVGAMSGDRQDGGWLSGRRLFDRDAKDVLERCLRIAVAHRDRRIGDEHILLALVTRLGVPSEVLADQGVTYEALNRVLYGEGERGGEAKAG